MEGDAARKQLQISGCRADLSQEESTLLLTLIEEEALPKLVT